MDLFPFPYMVIIFRKLRTVSWTVFEFPVSTYHSLHYKLNSFIQLLKLLEIQSAILRMESWQSIFPMKPMSQKPKFHLQYLLWFHFMKLSHIFKDHSY
ncbi:hypothetical protein L211DRAFT_577437 [Terfezia boudieri ATCC MYA-4762]|uniref:Uncharacterized protein n=1 Tax=Terfezia boudieri ATCC MYA-4762 TaxID=1051890 RepID=A0A3N4LB07_9PEZI|nr:hypothetical protein L211DRAFT_577437 [Terfezia boudieri ATCC MYA-4762]